ncbi:MAG: D-2-hydroxyacid dehydrogenase [Endozoicomonas sp.]
MRANPIAKKAMNKRFTGQLIGVILDAQTLGAGIELEPLKQLEIDWQIYPKTEPDQTLKRVEGAEVVLTNKVVLSDDLIRNSHSLKYIGVLATGMNNIDLEAAYRAGITVQNVVKYGNDSVAQHTLALMLSLATSLPAYSRDSQNGCWRDSDMFCLLDHPIMEIRGKTLLVVGAGELGSAVARLAEAFGMKVMFAKVPGSPTVANRVELDQGLAEADVVSLHCPLTPDTDHIIDARRLGLMKKHALLINTARGSLVNEQDLFTAIKSGSIGGAALDVLSEEPPRNGNILLSEPLPNLIITPHIAWASPEARQRVVDITAEKLMEYLQSV